jgi:hypothetical protein
MAPSRENNNRLTRLRDRVRAEIHQWRANLRNMLPGRRETAARSESSASSETPARQQWSHVVSAAQSVHRSFQTSPHTPPGDQLVVDMYCETFGFAIVRR